jgi:hypothetical protein
VGISGISVGSSLPNPTCVSTQPWRYVLSTGLVSFRHRNAHKCACMCWVCAYLIAVNLNLLILRLIGRFLQRSRAHQTGHCLPSDEPSRVRCKPSLLLLLLLTSTQGREEPLRVMRNCLSLGRYGTALSASPPSLHDFFFLTIINN